MRAPSLHALLLAAPLLLPLGCSSNASPSSTRAVASQAAALPPLPPSDAGTPSNDLEWYTTCGAPVCMVVPEGEDPPPTGAPPCTDEAVGDPCTTEGQMCDPGVGCRVNLVCASSDPKAKPWGCPISTKRAKRAITYLSDADARRVANEVNDIKLATYEYKDARLAGKRRLGFIIEDMPKSEAVRAPDQVDLYGYTSMVVAALKVQAKETEALKREVAELRSALEASRATAKPASKR